VCPKTGKVLQVPVVKIDAEAGTIVYRNEDGSLVETPVTGGNVKLQWKADWAGRWVALGVDYEMYGKDLIPSAELSAKIERILGGTPPDGFNYELFLDDKGQKISKSKGNGISIDEWLTYGPPESLSLFMFQQPRRAKRLHFDVIPRAVDDYLGLLEKFPAEEPVKQLDNPVWHIHDGKPPAQPIPITFGMLLNLAAVANSEDKNVLWGFITRYAPGASPQTSPFLDRLVGYACNYYRDFYKAQKKFRLPTPEERAQFEDLARTIRAQKPDTTAEQIQNEIYECGKRHRPQSELRQYFQSLYEVLLGTSQGPRMGAFVKLYGVDNVVKLIERALAGEDLSQAA
jgi:lysyl-tRNA synthetase class 1